MPPVGHGRLFKMAEYDGSGRQASSCDGGWGFETSWWRGAEENWARRGGTQTSARTRFTKVYENHNENQNTSFIRFT